MIKHPITAGLLWLILASTSLASDTSVEPYWQMFHGTAQHTGFVDITGPRQATLQWKFKAASGVEGAVPPNSIAVAATGVIYVGGPTKIYALRSNGTVKWSKRYSNVQGPALSANGKVLYMAGNNKLLALNARTGKRQWSVAMGDSTLFGPTLDADGIIYQGSWDGYLYAVNPDGTIKWQYQTAGAVSYPASVSGSGTIYVGGGDAHAGPDSNVYALKPNGQLKWTYDTSATRNGSPALGADGTIYVPAGPDLIVLNRDGSLAWQLGPGSNDSDDDSGDTPPGGDDGEQLNSITPQGEGDIAGIVTPAIAADGRIYIGNSDGLISAIDPDSHEVLWTYQTGADLDDATLYGLPSFPVVDNKGAVYFGAQDGKMYALSKTGSLLWTYETADTIAEAAPAFGPDGTLYFSSDDGYVYAINE